MGNDLVDGHSLVLVPTNDVEDTHTVAGDSGPASTDTRRLDDPL
jgi:hypothetical protein